MARSMPTWLTPRTQVWFGRSIVVATELFADVDRDRLQYFVLLHRTEAPSVGCEHGIIKATRRGKFCRTLCVSDLLNHLQLWPNQGHLESHGGAAAPQLLLLPLEGKTLDLGQFCVRPGALSTNQQADHMRAMWQLQSLSDCA